MNKKEWYAERWAALGDLTEVLKSAAPGYTDPNKYFIELILEEKNETVAEFRLELFEKVRSIDLEKQKEIELQKLRNRREVLLKDSDKTQLSDFPISTEERLKWRKYRQYLRDITEANNNNYNIMSFIEYCKWREDNKYRLNLE